MLKEASCYQEDGKWYMSLRYEYKAEDGKRTFIIPKMDFPQAILNDPESPWTFYGVNINEYLRIHPGPIWDPVNKEMFVDDIMGIIEDENQID